jgi:hypothetical protein
MKSKKQKRMSFSFYEEDELLIRNLSKEKNLKMCTLVMLAIKEFLKKQ